MAKPFTAVFKIGDQVELLSGGPKMTVTEIITYGTRDIRCSWFSGKKLESGQFPAGALKAATKDTDDGDK